MSTSRLGWAVGMVPILMLVFSAAMKLAGGPEVEKGFAHLGWSFQLAAPLAALELACVALYLVPSTAVLGAILLTGYLGGATATHVRIGDPWLITVALGVLLWLGLYLRDPRLRALIPLRSRA